MDHVLSTHAFFPKTGAARTFEISGDVTSPDSALDELIHEIRQPLGVIESLAYYLEITSGSEDVSRHLRQIQAMVARTNELLERARFSVSEDAV